MLAVGLSSPNKVKKFFLFFVSGGGGRVFAVFFAPFPGKGILDFIADRPIIKVFAVSYDIRISSCPGFHPTLVF